MICNSCESMFPDMCSDCLEVLQMDFSGVIEDDVKAFEASVPFANMQTVSLSKGKAPFAQQMVYQHRAPCGRLNIASGEDMPLLLEM